ncbi:acyl-CoA dehydrogenase [Porticoccaceae bacterium LTM1]|nr:acyl-CoA dehydrogenase [Porticoccaceae bacterium LTM1]
MTDYRAPLGDMQFLFDQVLGLEQIAKLPGYEEVSPDLVNAIMEEGARFFSEVVAPTNQIGDREGTSVVDGQVKAPEELKKAYHALVEAGWPSLAGNPEFGGQGMPHLISFALDEMCQSANLAFSLCPLLGKGVITALERYGNQDQKNLYLPKLISGEWAGTMNLTEPQAGSDLAAVRTKAIPEGDHYRISGQKIFITWGDHDFTDNIIHLVLARTPDAPEGVKGISLFIVPKFLHDADGNIGERNDVRPISVEHKLGIHGSPTCVLSYGEEGGALGYLVGEENAGLRYMFAMMNHARLSVGLQGVAIGERAYQQACEYARTRVQGSVTGVEGRAPIIKHPDIRRMLMLMRSQIEAGRALAYEAIAHEDFSLYEPDVTVAKRHDRRVDLLTPLVKGWCTEMAQEVTSLGVQIHGGMGYIEETGAAQHFRDARILPIYEGTNGIQAMDLIGRKLLRDQGEALQELAGEFHVLLGELEKAGKPMASIHRGLGQGLYSADKAIRHIFTHVMGDWSFPNAVAYNLLMLLGTTAAGALLAKSALAAHRQLEKGEGNAEFCRNKIITAQFYAEHLMPRTTSYMQAITAGHDSIMALPEDQF